jgi:hypothetical protein
MGWPVWGGRGGEFTREPVPTWEVPAVVRRDGPAHRAEFLSLLGTASLVCGVLSVGCFVFGFLGLSLGVTAWVMAGGDLERMRAGTMDSSGRRGTERAGRRAALGVFLCGFSWFLAPFGWALLERALWQPR